MGGLQTFAARHTNGSYAQKVYFAKLREWPKPAVRGIGRRRSAAFALQTFVHRAAS
jgi:hypothetical protein